MKGLGVEQNFARGRKLVAAAVEKGIAPRRASESAAARSA